MQPPPLRLLLCLALLLLLPLAAVAPGSSKPAAASLGDSSSGSRHASQRGRSQLWPRSTALNHTAQQPSSSTQAPVVPCEPGRPVAPSDVVQTNDAETPAFCPHSTPPNPSCPSGYYERFGAAQVAEHFVEQPPFRVVDHRAHTYMCVDSRDVEPMLGAFGGDFAESIAAAVALLRLTEQAFNGPLVDAVFDALMERVITPERPMYMHSDDTRLRQLFVYLSTRPGFQEEPSIMPLHGPSDPGLAEEWLAGLSQPQFQGCGHLRHMLTNTSWYAVDLASPLEAPRNCTHIRGGSRSGAAAAAAGCVDTAAVAARLIRRYIRSFWFSPLGSEARAKAAFAVDGILVGPSLGKAVAVVQARTEDDQQGGSGGSSGGGGCAHASPLVRPDFGSSQVYVLHAEAVRDWRAFAAQAALQPLLARSGHSAQELSESWSAIVERVHGPATLTLLSPVNDDGQFTVTVPLRSTPQPPPPAA